jgi:hypothetical protein
VTVMNIKRKAIALVMVVAVAGLVAAARHTNAAAPRPTAVEYQTFGVASLITGQGARVNVFNALEEVGLTLTVHFLDAEGQVLKREVHYLKPGQTGTAEFVPAVQTLSRRFPTRAIVESVPDAPEISGRQVVANLEVFQVKTHVTGAVYMPQLTTYK